MLLLGFHRVAILQPPKQTRRVSVSERRIPQPMKQRQPRQKKSAENAFMRHPSPAFAQIGRRGGSARFRRDVSCHWFQSVRKLAGPIRSNIFGQPRCPRNGRAHIFQGNSILLMARSLRNAFLNSFRQASPLLWRRHARAPGSHQQGAVHCRCCVRTREVFRVSRSDCATSAGQP